MKSNLIKRLPSLCLAVLLLITMIAGCGKNKENSDSDTVLTDCTITIKTAGGIALENIGVSIYTDTDKKNLVDFVRTDANGTISTKGGFTSGNAYIFLTDVPAGYAVKEYYTITEKNTVIQLSASLGTEMTPIKLGGIMFDFTITDQHGTEHTLSKLLESKKAAVINLWYTTCVPCKMEFPYLQQAYSEYKDDIALLAISPMDNAEAVAAFANENGLSIPMAACDPAWDGLVDGIAYPTTIVVDRFGSVALIHTGSIDNSKTFKNVFAHFSADDYKQSTFADISTFIAGADEPLGTASNPYVHNGDGSFTVSVEPAQTVYYTLFDANGLTLSADSASLKLVCDEKEYTPNNGKLSFTIRATDATTPVLMNFTNTGSEKTTYKVTLTAPEGVASNPIAMKDGSVTVKLDEDNSQGVYYQYKAPNEGTFTLECKNTVNYTVVIKNLNGTETAKLDQNTKKVSLNVRKNDKIQVVVTAVAKDGKYPATEAKLNATFKKEEIPATPPTGSSGNSSSLNTNGKLVNPDAPIEHAGAQALNFNADVKAGEIVLFHLYRVSGTTMRIADASAYVIYKDKTYTPDKNGNLYLPVTSDSPNNPIVLKIGNGGKTNKTYAVKFSYPEGSMMNPYDAKAGSTKTNIAADNEQGIYYQCIAEKDGKVTIQLKSTTAKCDIRVTVVDASLIPLQYLLSETEDGKTLVVEVAAGDEIEINIVALPDEDYKYPAATIETTLSFS